MRPPEGTCHRDLAAGSSSDRAPGWQATEVPEPVGPAGPGQPEPHRKACNERARKVARVVPPDETCPMAPGRRRRHGFEGC